MAMEMLNDVMTSAYLTRIGWEGDAPVTRETLDGLVYAHQCSVPFETADLVALGETPSLERVTSIKRLSSIAMVDFASS